VKVPIAEFAVKTAAVATPLAFVHAVVLVPPLSLNKPLAVLAGPDIGTVNDGAENVTTALGIGSPLTSSTVADNWTGKGVLTAVVCGVPAVAVIVIGATVFDSVKVAVDVSPSWVVAVTV